MHGMHGIDIDTDLGDRQSMPLALQSEREAEDNNHQGHLHHVLSSAKELGVRKGTNDR